MQAQPSVPGNDRLEGHSGGGNLEVARRFAEKIGPGKTEAAVAGRDAIQTRDYCVAKCATHRAARPDPSLRNERLLGTIISGVLPTEITPIIKRP